MGKLTKEEILNKAIHINNSINYVKICLEANICPECGDTLKSKRDCDEECEVSWLLIYCKCGYKYKSNYHYNHGY